VADATLCFCEKYTAIEDSFKRADSSESSSIRVVKELFSHNLSGNLSFIKSTSGAISSAITRLEAVGSQPHNSSGHAQGTERQTRQAHDKVADRVESKLKTAHFRNNGHSAICTSVIFSENEAQLEDDETALYGNDLVFKYAPKTSCDIEKSFSCY
jgi:hypothetical protein